MYRDEQNKASVASGAVTTAWITGNTLSGPRDTETASALGEQISRLRNSVQELRRQGSRACVIADGVFGPAKGEAGIGGAPTPAMSGMEALAREASDFQDALHYLDQQLDRLSCI